MMNQTKLCRSGILIMLLLLVLIIISPILCLFTIVYRYVYTYMYIFICSIYIYIYSLEGMSIDSLPTPLYIRISLLSYIISNYIYMPINIILTIFDYINNDK